MRDTTGAQSGFSLIEALIASLILLFVALGTIPLFTMAAQSNLQGNENTKAANYARERLEQLAQLSFNAELITITAGTERSHTEYYDNLQKKWLILVGSTPPGTLWTRFTKIRQFSVNDLETPISAADAASNPASVQIKEISVFVDSTRVGGAFGGGKSIALLAYKSQ
jgi:type II secretory pathway pseudopilin PulG